MNIPKSVTLFTNGCVMAFDDKGEQMAEIQKDGWLDLWLDSLEAKGIDPTKIERLTAFVNGFWQKLTVTRRGPDSPWKWAVEFQAMDDQDGASVNRAMSHAYEGGKL